MVLENLTGQSARAPFWRSMILIGIWVAAAALILLALIAPSLLGDGQLALQAGQVADADIRAPTAITYQSQVLTEAAQEAAAATVSPVFDPPDTRIARKQVERLRAVINFISTVRADTFASEEQKLTDLAALEDIQLNQDTALKILALNDARWSAVSQEAVVVLEQVMRDTIRDTQLEAARRRVPALVSLAIPIDQAEIVAALASAMVAPNSLFNETLTEEARENARQSVPPVQRSFAAGETVIDRGRVLTLADLEALDRLGLLQSENRWQDTVGAAALALVSVGFFTFYLRFRPAMLYDLRSLAVFAVLFFIFLFGARLSIPGRTVIPYLYPLPAFSLVLAALFGTAYGLTFAVPLSILVSYGLPNALDLMLFYLLGSAFGVLMLGKGQRITLFIWAGVGISVTASAIVIAFRLPDPTADLIGVTTLVGAAIFNGIGSASLAILLQFFLAQILGLTTALQLMEISRPDNELLKYVLRTAPGTYQHSLQVANLAEQAAERIGADPLLTRVGALYHDVGKALNPYFFIENQPEGFRNPHDDLSPVESAHIIIRHVTDGLDLARKYRLPRRLHDFILEHHGTQVTRYQYVNAVNQSGGDESLIDKSLFRYPGPKPQTRESALVMLADGVEARARAERPQTEKEVFELVKSIIESRLSQGQLDQTEITTRDLRDILDVFTATMRGWYHPRIIYPKLEKEQPAALASPADPDAELTPETFPQADTST